MKEAVIESWHNIKWVFVLYSLAAIGAMVLIGVAVALRSMPGIALSILLLLAVMGLGFKRKKDMREAGIL
ncbi:YlaF family protein [Planococcus sp. ISL-109]|uniref:YlaF family protein n=1 Tax=Planococcus sp. ISL-109 TaxID=2819166 RepID=UPI001BE7DD52|nr:YlaF family protein [Planococcus sp. ISL-109]MBT2581814.1 YlaF family protein [Planococcus sp. ISL-109]